MAEAVVVCGGEEAEREVGEMGGRRLSDGKRVKGEGERVEIGLGPHVCCICVFLIERVSFGEMRKG